MISRNPDQPVSIPAWFLTEAAPRIREVAELQVMLAFFRLQSGSETWSEPVAYETLEQDEILNRSLRLEGAVRSPADAIRRGLELSVARDTLLQFTVESEAVEREQWLLLGTPENRIKLERYRSGAIAPPSRSNIPPPAARIERARPGVFGRYEQNVGMVTPIIADRLVEALELYPESWIDDAIEAAVSYNRRNWRYIQRILETWATEGRSNETNRRHQSTTGDFDPDRHLSGEYAAIFRRRRRE